MKKISFLFVAILTMTFLLTGVGKEKPNPSNLSFEDVYTVKPIRGKNAKEIKFSENDRYIAFLWNKYEDFNCRLLLRTRPYQETGFDLYIYDTKTGKLKRVTSMERMKQFDPPEDIEDFIKKRKQILKEEDKLQAKFMAQRDFLMGKSDEGELTKFEKEEIEKLKEELKKKEEEKKAKEAEEKAKKDKEKTDTKADDKAGNKADEKTDEKAGKKTEEVTDKEKKEKKDKELELWELRDKLAKKKEKEKVKRSDLYPGVSGYEWAPKKSELIFEYRGDLYRYFPASDKILRLTMTDGDESIISYMKDGNGYYYNYHSMVFKVRFNSSYVQQINHRLKKEDKYNINSTRISPNDKWMLILAAKREGASGYKDVQIMDYSKRFAESFKVKRQVADDKRNEPKYHLILREIRNTNYGDQPEHIFEIPGGDVWYEFSDAVWAKDSSKYAFMTWEREKGDLKIWLGKTQKDKKPEVLFEMKEKIGFKGSYDDNIRFTPDGKSLVAILNNKDGFRQPVMIDLKTKKVREIIKGKFESFPIVGFSKNGKDMFILSDKGDPAIHNVYKVSIATGKMTRIGKPGGMHRKAVISHNGRLLAFNFGNWDQMPEMYVRDTSNQTEKMITSGSHLKNWEEHLYIKPEIFTYKNRHGDTIRGMIFKPFNWKPEDKRPGIVYMYGGPLNDRHTIEVDSFSTLAFWFQMMMAAKHGYVTVNIDPRGQSGYGRDFSEANFKKPGIPQTEDLEDLVKHMEKGFGVDTKNLGLHGWSFGGFQTIKTMLASPETFACGIAVASVTEWENYNSWYAGSTIDKSVRGKPTLRRHSLIPEAYRLKHPLLLIHGMKDPNVLYQDTLKMYDAFLRAGKETLIELFLDPEGDHSLEGSILPKGFFKKFESWFVRHLEKNKKK